MMEQEPQRDPFERLEELVSMLPRMEERGARLARARDASRICELERARATADAMLAEVDGPLEAEKAALVQAEGAGDAEAAEKHRDAAIFYERQRGYRVGPAQNARLALREALDASPFSSVDEAAASMIPDEDEAMLVREVEDYRAEYEAVLAVCTAAESAVRDGADNNEADV